jgi:hypothetical protein
MALLAEPPLGGGPITRVLTVTKAQHEMFYNPDGFEFLEFHAKNIAAVMAVLSRPILMS